MVFWGTNLIQLTYPFTCVLSLLYLTHIDFFYFYISQFINCFLYFFSICGNIFTDFFYASSIEFIVYIFFFLLLPAIFIQRFGTRYHLFICSNISCGSVFMFRKFRPWLVRTYIIYRKVFSWLLPLTNRLGRVLWSRVRCLVVNINVMPRARRVRHLPHTRW